MIGATLLTVVLASAAVDEPPLLPDAAAFVRDATVWLLEGEPLPPDYRTRLLAMPPEARLQALVFLRRAGLLTATPWPLSDVLDPATGGSGQP